MNVELIYLQEDATWQEQVAAVWSVIKQDLTPLSESERDDVLRRCHEALRLDPERSGIGAVPHWEKDPENPKQQVRKDRPTLHLSGLRELTARYGGEVLVEDVVEDPVAGSATVTVRAQLPFGAQTFPGIGGATTQQAHEYGETAVEFAQTKAVRFALSRLVRTPSASAAPQVQRPSQTLKRTVAPSTSLKPGDAERDPKAPPEVPTSPLISPPPLAWSSGPEAEDTTPLEAEVEQDLASLAAMGPALSDPEAAEQVDVAAPDWCLPAPDFGSARLPWPAPLVRKSSVGQGDVSPGQVRDYKRLLEERGVVGDDAIERFTAHLMTGAHGDTLPPQALQAQELARKIEQVREMASSKEMQKLDAALDERGYLDAESRRARLEELLGVKDERDLGFVSSRAVAQAMRSLADEPTLTQIHECRGLLERIGVTEPYVMGRRIADALGHDDPVAPEDLTAKEIDALIHSMRPTVDRMKIKTKIPTVRQRMFPWSPDR